MNSAKLAVSLGAVTLALSGLTASAATNVVSDPVGFYKIAINPGANAISAPLQEISTFKGTVASVSGDTITFTGSPGFMADAFAPVTVNASPRAQYVAILCNDADKAANDPNNATGDWWTIASNAAGAVTVVNGGDTLSSFVAAGDQVEIRKLNTVAKLFGASGSSIMAPDEFGLFDPNFADVVVRFSGTSFDEFISYNNAPGSTGYFVGSDGPLDGSQLTILPNEGLVFFRRTDLNATNICVLGGVQTKRLTQYLAEGATAIGGVFPAVAPLSSSGLQSTPGFVNDAFGLFDPNFNDVLTRLDGTSFGEFYSFQDDGMGGAWADSNSGTPNTQSILPGRAYIAFVPVGTGNRRWRQSVPFAP